MSVHKEAEAMPVVAEAKSVATDIEQEEEHVQLSSPQPSMRHTIMHISIKVAGLLLCVMLEPVVYSNSSSTCSL